MVTGGPSCEENERKSEGDLENSRGCGSDLRRGYERLSQLSSWLAFYPSDVYNFNEKKENWSQELGTIYHKL